MRRYLLVSTALAALAAPASAETISTAITTPVKTSTIKNGAPDAITISSSGSVKPTGGTAVTMDSNHSVTNQGTIAIAGANGAIGIAATAGTTGDIVNSGTITIDEAYTPEDSDKDGDLDGPFAVGSGRFGIRTDGAHAGKIENSGTITVEGNDSAGIWLGGPLTGNFTHDGKTTVLGDRSVGVHAGPITGNVRLAGTVTATGKDAVAAHFAGDVNGAMVVQGEIVSTGYRHTTPPADSSKLDADDLLQGGPALLIEGNVTGGIVLAVPPKDASPTDNDENDDGIEDAKEGSAKVVSYGAAPAMVIGATDHAVAIGAVANTANNFGLIIDGQVAGNGVYAGVDGNGLVIGGRGGAVTIANGMSVSGTVSATSNGANATALRIGNGASVPEIRVSGTVSAAGGGGETAKSAAILVDAGANVGTIRNSGTIKATAGGANGSAAAIQDLSGKVALIENSGTISASGAAADSTRNVAIDLSANTTGAVVKQTQVASGITAPSIAGDVRFGSGNDEFDIADGTVKGTVSFGAGNNKLTLSGDASQSGKVVFGGGADAMSLAGTSKFAGTVDFGGGADTLALAGTSLFSGSLLNAGALAVTVSGGTLDLSAPSAIGSLSVGANGTLAVTLDKDAGQGTFIQVGGTASFAKDASLSLRLADATDAVGRYVVLEAGTLEGASGLKTRTDLLPYMFKASIANDAGPNQLAIDIAKRTTTELGLNRSQAAAYDAIFASLSNEQKIEDVFLGITDGDTFREQVGDMLPDHAGGTFAGVSLGSRTFARRLTDPARSQYTTGNLSLILDGGFWGTDKDQGETAAYNLTGFGFSGAAEIETGVGSFGASLAWMWNEHTRRNNDNVVTSDTFELAAYWHGQWGGFSAYGRGSVGKAMFDGKRTFNGTAGDQQVQRKALREWNGTLVTFNAGASYETGGRYLFIRPAVAVDYAKLKEDGSSETGGGDGIDLTIDERTSDELAVSGGVTVGVDFMGNGRRDEDWFRVEGEGGWREIVGGELGSTTAHFKNGDDFTLDPEQSQAGWYARLRAYGGTGGYSVGGEVSAEDRLGGIAYTLRGTMRIGF